MHGRNSSHNSNIAVPNRACRWKHNIDELYSALKLDELIHVSSAQMQHIKSLITQYRNIFSENDLDLGCTDLLEQEIILDTNVPIRDKYYNILLQLRPHAEKEIKRLLDLNIIEESTSNYHSPSFLMKKGNDYRLLTDFRKLNKHVIRSWQPIPGLEEMLVLWNNCKYYSKMDFAKGFYQTPLKRESRHYTATSIPGIGFFQYVKSPLGLSSSPCYFQSLVEKIFMGLKQNQCVVYLDDILSAHKSFEGMIENLRLIFERVKSSKMLLKPSKCELFKQKIKFLGVYLDENGVSPCPEKVDSIKKMIKPANVKGVRSFLGLSGFYRRFVKNYSAIAEPLTRLTKKGVKFEWSPEADVAFESIKTELVNAKLLRHPDMSKQFTLITDASSYAVGAVLSQKGEDNLLHPICYGSSVLTDAQRKWSTVQRELYSLVHFCEKNKNFLLAQTFEVITDNSALLHLEKFKNVQSNRLWRWFEKLQNYKFTITYCPSNQNPSDALSRLPSASDPLIKTVPLNAVTKAPPEKKGHTIVFLPNQKILTAQSDDTTISTVKTWMESGEKPNSSSHLTADLYTYYNSFDRLSIRDGILFRKWDLGSHEQPTQLVCLPSSLQQEVISLAHDIPTAGHLALHKTLEKIRTRFYFPKMHLKTSLYIDQCHVCLKGRRNHQKLKAPLTPFAGTEPGHIVQMDLMENLPMVNGYHAILVIIDTFTKWAEAIPLTSTKVEHIARAFLNTWICRQSVPSQLHSDRGANLATGKIIQEVYKMLSITKTMNCSYRPQTDGHVERVIGTLKNLLWKYCQENPTNWLNCLNQVMFAYRTTIHSTTGYSPYFLDKGRLPRLPLDIVMGTDVKSSLGEDGTKSAYDLYTKLQETYKFVNENIKGHQISSKKRYDEKANVKHFDVGSWVYVYKPTPPGCTYKKFYDNYRGPFQITEKLTPHTYKIVLDRTKGTSDIVHMEHLKQAQQPLNEYHTNTHYSDDPQPVLLKIRQPVITKRPNNIRARRRPIISIPINRRSNRQRRQRVPYQHRP